MKIQSVLAAMTPDKYAHLTMQMERERQANLRLARIEAEDEKRRQGRLAWERGQILLLDRPEYRSLRHAQWKNKLYRRTIKRDEWQAFQIRNLYKRRLERERKKDEWQEFNPAEVLVDLSNLPEF